MQQLLFDDIDQFYEQSEMSKDKMQKRSEKDHMKNTLGIISIEEKDNYRDSKP